MTGPTDGDGDQVCGGGIGTHINFLDDGPSNISPLAVSLLNGLGSAELRRWISSIRIPTTTTELMAAQDIRRVP